MTSVVCKFHPNLVANEICDKCHSPICVNDIRRLTRGRIVKIYCPQCAKSLKKRDRRIFNIVYLISIPVLIIVLYLLYMKSQGNF